MTQHAPGFTRSSQQLEQLWEQHLEAEFETKDVEATLTTTVEDAYVNHMPVRVHRSGRHAGRQIDAGARRLPSA